MAERLPVDEVAAPSSEELSAYLDGELDAARRAEISYYLSVDHDVSEYVLAQRAIRDGLRALSAQTNVAPVPTATLTALDRLRRPSRSSIWQWLRPPAYALSGAALAAAVLLYVWTPPAMFPSQSPPWLESNTLYFLDQGARSEEFGALSTQSISQTLPGFQLASRNTQGLQSAGFTLKGGRVMAMDGTGAILLIYEDPFGAPLGLMIWRTALDPVRVGSGAAGGVETVLWTDGPFSFALTGRQEMSVLRSFRDAYLSR